MDPPSNEQQNAPHMPGLGLSLDQLRSAGKADQGSGTGDAGIAAVAVAKAAAVATQVGKAHAVVVTAVVDFCYIIFVRSDLDLGTFDSTFLMMMVDGITSY